MIRNLIATAKVLLFLFSAKKYYMESGSWRENKRVSKPFYFVDNIVSFKVFDVYLRVMAGEMEERPVNPGAHLLGDPWSVLWGYTQNCVMCLR